MKPTKDIDTKIQFNRGRPNIEIPKDNNSANPINRITNPKREVSEDDHAKQSIKRDD